MALLTVEKLGVVYEHGAHETVALQDATFAIEPGEVVCVLGPNGAGKTSLLKCISQLIVPSHGQIVWSPIVMANGNDLHSRLGVLLEGSRAFYWNLTGMENARYFAALKGLPTTVETENHLANLFELLNLTSVKDKLTSAYSTGMKKRFSLLIALLGNPALLLLDEPTQGLDAASVIDLELYLHRISATGTAVLCTSHDLAFTFNVATRLLYLESGQLQTWDWKTSIAQHNHVIFLLAGKSLPDVIAGNNHLTSMPNGRVRLKGYAADPSLYQLLWQLIATHGLQVLQVYGVN